MTLNSLCAAIVGKGTVTPDDVLAMRREVFGDIAVTDAEAEALFRIDEATTQRCSEWRDFFLEAITDWLVRQREPAGYIDEANADWLIARIRADGRARNATEVELIIRVLEQADSAPARLAAFGLSLATRAVIANDGVITADEVERMRRVVFAMSGDGGIAVTREEAAALFDLNDAARGRPNDPAWTDFFKRAVANAITAAAGWIAPDQVEALRREAWLTDTDDGIGAAFVRQLVAGEIGPITWQDPADAVFEARLDANARAAAAAAPVDAAEARWLLDRIGRDGEYDVNERALIAFLGEIAPLDPSLRALADRAAA